MDQTEFISSNLFVVLSASFSKEYIAFTIDKIFLVAENSFINLLFLVCFIC